MIASIGAFVPTTLQIDTSIIALLKTDKIIIISAGVKALNILIYEYEVALKRHIYSSLSPALLMLWFSHILVFSAFQE